MIHLNRKTLIYYRKILFYLSLLLIFIFLTGCISTKTPISHIKTGEIQKIPYNTDKNFLKESISEFCQKHYGPLFSFDNQKNSVVSFGVKCKKSFQIEDDSGKAYIKFVKGVNRISGLWNQDVGKLFTHLSEVKNFPEKIKKISWPDPGKPGKFSVTFGTGTRSEYDSKQLIFKQMLKKKPNAFMEIGDTIYNDLPYSSPINYELDRKYDLQLQIANFEKFYKNIPMYIVWDDHDFWANNVDRNSVKPVNRKWSLDLFKAIIPNPSFGENGEGIYFKWSLGDVDFFMLDTRWFREKNKKIMLGKKQNQWLRNQLKNSSATFKIIVSSVQWHHKSRSDSWKGYLDERNELFQFIFEEKIKGVFLLSGDIHHAQAFRLNPELSAASQYPLIEFTSSGLAVPVKDRLISPTKEIEPLMHVPNKLNFGMLEFNTEDKRAYVDLKVYVLGESKPAKWNNQKDFFRIYADQLRL